LAGTDLGPGPIPGPFKESSGGGRRWRFIILGAVVALAVAYMAYAAFPGNTRYFLTVSEFLEQPNYQTGQPVRVSGKLVDGSFQRQGDTTTAQFQLVDKTAGSAGGYLHATYTGVVPDLFFNPHSEIILEGRYGADHRFQTDNILVKCPSKYQALEEAQNQG